MRGLNAYAKIRAAMRRNEVELLAHLRKHGGIWNMVGLGTAWTGAFNRLYEAGRIVYEHNYYVAQPGAGPITPALRK